jgi:hypothetical protein
MDSPDVIKGKRQIEIYQKAQKYVDSECIRRMDKYTKFRTGALIKSATENTKIGSGQIIQRTPYARVQYYNYEAVQNDTGLRGRYWFERMKTDNLTDIKKGVGLITGGKIR